MCGQGLPSTTHLSHGHKLLALLQLRFNSALFDTKKTNTQHCLYPKRKADSTHISQHNWIPEREQNIPDSKQTSLIYQK